MKAKRSFLKQSDYNSYIFFSHFSEPSEILFIIFLEGHHSITTTLDLHHNKLQDNSCVAPKRTAAWREFFTHYIKTMEVLHIPSINKKQLKMAEPQKNTQKIRLVILPPKNPTSNKWSEAVFLPTLLTPDHFLEGNLFRSETEWRGFPLFPRPGFIEYTPENTSAFLQVYQRLPKKSWLFHKKPSFWKLKTSRRLPIHHIIQFVTLSPSIRATKNLEFRSWTIAIPKRSQSQRSLGKLAYNSCSPPFWGNSQPPVWSKNHLPHKKVAAAVVQQRP